MHRLVDPGVELEPVRVSPLQPPDRHALDPHRAPHPEADSRGMFRPRRWRAAIRLRADDTARGGDIDLLIEVNTTNPADIMRAQTLFMARLLTRLGDRKVDVLVDYPSRQTHPPIFDVARREGIPL